MKEGVPSTAAIRPTTYLFGDHLGSSSLATNASGAVVAETRYKPYGEIRWSSGAMPTDFGYTGQRLEKAGYVGSLMDYKARAYSPALGRFVSADTIVPGAGNPQTLNRYAYVLNLPLSLVDPSGNLPCATSGCGQEADYTNEPVYIVPRSVWNARDPVLDPTCLLVLCFGPGSQEGRYDPATNPSGYAPYSLLRPGSSLSEIYDTVVIHHEGNGQTNNIKKIQDKHMDDEGWSDIGYTFAIAPDGTIYEARPIGIRGSHTANANTGKIGILIMGDFEPGSDFLGRHWDWDPNGDDPGPTPAQMRSAKALVAQLDRVYGIDRVIGHQDVPGNATECPGVLCLPFVRELDSIVKE